MPRNPLHTVVRTPEQFQVMMNRVAAAKALSIDTETSGLKWFQHARICGVGVACWDESGNTHAFYTPYRHQTGEQQLDEKVITPAFKYIWEKDVLKIGAHLKFEDHMGRREGWQLKGTRYDVQVAAHLFDENRDIGLKKRAKSDLGRADAEAWDSALDREIVRLAKLSGLGKKKYKDRYGYAQIPVELAGFYGCNDVDFAAGLHSVYEQRHKISSYYGRIWQTEMALTEVLCDIEEAGLPINVPYLENLRDALGGIQAGLESQVHAILGPEMFPLGADDALREHLEKTLRLPLWKTTEKGDKYSVDSEVLAEWAPHHRHLGLIMQWREAEKLRNTYTTSILERLDSNNILHGSLRQNGTDTGRMSSSEPNLQNFPSDDDDRATIEPVVCAASGACK